ncbi:MAG: PilZ domain-containing protein [Novosphingobium sp.]
MDEAEQRRLARDSLFVMADLRLDGSDEEHRIKMRNLSSGGMMGEGSIRVMRGALVQVHIRNIGWVDGSIAWVQDDRFGIAFNEEIDPKVARSPAVPGEHSPRFTKPPLSDVSRSGVVRKI